MKRPFFLILLFISFSNLNAQDVILWHHGFYLSMGVGPVFGKISDDLGSYTMDMSGTGALFDFKIGGAIKEKLKQQAKKEAKLLAEVTKVIEKLKDGAVKIGAKTGTSGKIFGSVTSVQIARAIREQKGYEIDRRKIHILDNIKELGNFKAKVDFGNGNETEIELEVISE